MKAKNMTRYNCRQPVGAFTLLEVMVAVSILSIALIALLGNQGQSVGLAEESSFYFRSSRLAKEKLAQIAMSGEEIWGRSDGGFGEEVPGYLWRSETIVSNLSDNERFSAAEPYLKLLELTVYTEDNKKSYTVRRYILTGFKQVSTMRSWVTAGSDK